MAGLYTGAVGMISNMLKLDIHANNVSNVQTNGYKKEEETFRVHLETKMRMNSGTDSQRIGRYHDGVYVDDVSTDYKAGPATATNRDLDVMIDDQKNKNEVSFFVVKDKNGTHLTRNGNFTLDAERRLSTLNGALVLGKEGGSIVIPESVRVVITKDGRVEDAATKKELGAIALVSVDAENTGLLKKREGGFYDVMDYRSLIDSFGSIDALIGEFDHNGTLQRQFSSKETLVNIAKNKRVDILQPFNGEIRQWALERSNVDTGDEMVGILQAQKGVQLGQKVVQSMNDVLTKEVNDIAK